MTMISRTVADLLFISVVLMISCNKKNEEGPYTLRYGSDVIYLKNQSSDHIVYPLSISAGTYTAFPDGIELDEKTGAINVSKSETGLRYKITYTAPEGDTNSALIVLSGITFPDHFYHLSQSDSIAYPIYNANNGLAVPVNGSSFDEGNTANNSGCSVKTQNGQINLAETVRNGIFGSIPQNDVRKDFEIEYRLNDASEKALNKLRVRLYYYNTLADVPPDLWQTLNDRVSQGVFLQMNNQGFSNITARTAGVTALAKPRPPCVIIIGQ